MTRPSVSGPAVVFRFSVHGFRRPQNGAGLAWPRRADSNALAAVRQAWRAGSRSTMEAKPALAARSARGGIGVSISFNPTGVTKESIDIEATPCSTSVVSHSLSASVEVACWNHVRSVASTRCPFALLSATAVATARVTDWDPNYRIEVTHDDSVCGPEPGPLLPF